MERIKLVVLDEHTLGYIQLAQPKYVSILHASILKGSPFPKYGIIPIDGHSVRLASEKDFDDYRVSFEGYKRDPHYEYAV